MNARTSKLLSRYANLFKVSVKKSRRAWQATPRPLRGKLRRDLRARMEEIA